MADIVVWPHELLTPEGCFPNLVPFTRSGGRTLGGIETATRTDLGFWSIDLNDIAVYTREQRQTWIAIRQKLGGKAGLIAVPAWSFDAAPYVSGEREPPVLVTHDDDTTFDDGTPYEQGSISVVSDGVTALGATVMRLRVIKAAPNMVGVRFSYEHALYETGPVISIDGDIWTVPVSPTVRAIIPHGADLEFDNPTCLCRLADDRGMDGGVNSIEFEQRSVTFSEAVDYWSDLAAS
ncbi:hypothetical protein SAMN02982989_3423 [Xaviernesmea oryzae]|uniref:Uncharacterized protein n=1 Tax=Xaviernesmea oryzae TaxID=464029 RepID=A0A1X7GAA6_9HYPH|nr:hypothetical protein [Xaviernesmea oryzae]SMF65972.1 hypothetical protein SAMN02982989_3423 [Xaviernesmea oryzae]